MTAAVHKAELVENAAWWVSRQRMHVMCVILANPGERMSALFYESVEHERPCIVYIDIFVLVNSHRGIIILPLQVRLLSPPPSPLSGAQVSFLVYEGANPDRCKKSACHIILVLDFSALKVQLQS